MTYQYLSLYNILLIKTLNPRVKGATPLGSLPQNDFSLREGDFMVAGGLIFSALGTCLCRRENRARGGPETIGCTHRAADDTRPKAERRGTRETPKSARARAKTSPVGEHKTREIDPHSRKEIPGRRTRKTPNSARTRVKRSPVGEDERLRNGPVA